MAKKLMINTYLNGGTKLEFAAGGSKGGLVSPRPGAQHMQGLKGIKSK